MSPTSKDLRLPSSWAGRFIPGQNNTHFTSNGFEKAEGVAPTMGGFPPGRPVPHKMKAMCFVLVTLFITLLWTCRNGVLYSITWRPGLLSTSPAPSISSFLEVFQVYPPVLVNSQPAIKIAQSRSTDHEIYSSDLSADGCSVVLMEHSFGFSYGKPFIGNYTPPMCKFNRVTMNFTVTSKGRQFDRLAIMYFNDTEIWRTSTAEPTFNGIRWEHIKDMSAYNHFWSSPQTIIFDLGNLVNDVYTGFFNTTLTATFSLVEATSHPASMIIPISARKGSENKASLFMLPDDTAKNTISFPRNVNRAVFTVSACGQATEEFWWANVLQSHTNTFKNVTGTLYGYSSFREVQVLIDGHLAGVQWPFPVIFTGGVVPGLWRPIVGIDTFDLREHEIDITPWLSLLCDGKDHSFEIRVVGIDNDKNTANLTKTVGNSWYVTGKIFLWLDDDTSAVTTGSAPTILLPSPVVSLSSSITRDETGANETLAYITNVQRTLSISSFITTRSGTHLVSWTQNLAVTNYNLFTNFGAVQYTEQETTGIDQSTGPNYYTVRYRYPLRANTSFFSESSGNFTLDATLRQGLHLNTQGESIFSSFPPSSFPSTTISTTLNGSAHYFASPSARISTGFGSTSQIFHYNTTNKQSNENNKRQHKSANDREQETTYYRNVEAVNGTLIRDDELLNAGFSKLGPCRPTNGERPAVAAGGSAFAPRQAIGRGFGEPRKALLQTGNDYHG